LSAFRNHFRVQQNANGFIRRCLGFIRVGSARTDPATMSRTILAKRIIKMAHRDDMTQIEQLRDDALAHLQNNPFFQVTLEPKNASSAVGSLRFLSPQVDLSQELVATGPPTNVPIRRSSSCFSGPLPAAMRKAPISISVTWPPEGRFGSCL